MADSPTSPELIVESGQYRLRFNGVPDVAHLPLLKDLEQQVPSLAPLSLDLAHVEHLDSRSLGVLLMWRAQISSKTRRVLLVNCRPGVLKIVTMAGLGRFFEIQSVPMDHNLMRDLPERYRINRPDIDLQHAVLFSLIALIEERLAGHSSDLSPQRVLKSLRDYVEVHFNHEESLLGTDPARRPSAHLAAHRGFEARIGDFERQFAAADLQGPHADAALQQVRDYLRLWLEHHIEVVDRASFSGL
ncbi:MAG: STAS domain-containing protein [Magnetococcus sp. WYHC-3]